MRRVLLSAILLVLAACGQKGPLYHPDEGTTVAPAATAPVSSAPAAPDAAATPAPVPPPTTDDSEEARKRVPQTPTPAETR